MSDRPRLANELPLLPGRERGRYPKHRTEHCPPDTAGDGPATVPDGSCRKLALATLNWADGPVRSLLDTTGALESTHPFALESSPSIWPSGQPSVEAYRAGRYPWFLPPPGSRRVSARHDRVMAWFSFCLLAAILAVSGFAGGAYVTLSGPSDAGTPFSTGQPTGMGAGPTPVGLDSGLTAGIAGGGAGTITGTVKLIDGSDVYIEDDQGNVIKAITSDQTALLEASPADLGAVGLGGPVTITGAPGPDGVLAATTIIAQSDGSGTSSAKD